MTPDRLVDFIPTVLDWLHPQPMPDIAGDAVAICNWYAKLLDRSTVSGKATNGTNIAENFLGKFWPSAPKIDATGYTLARAITVAQLRTPASAPVRFCNHAGHNPLGDTLPTLHQCPLVAGHVIASNGELAFQREDFTLPGPFPFHWQRYYRQSQQADAGLGQGWRHTLSECLQLPEATPGAAQKVLLHSADGRLVAFDLPAIGHASFNRSERLYLLRQSLHSFRLSAFDAPDKIFRADGTGKFAPLCEIRDASGNTLSVDYRNGHPEKIVSSWGSTIDFHYDNGKLTKIASAATGDGSALCHYDYDSDGFLVATRTAAGEESFTLQAGKVTALTNLSSGHLVFIYDKLQRVSEIHRTEEAGTKIGTAAADDNPMTWKLRWRSGAHTCIVSAAGEHDIQLRFDTRGNLIESSQGGRSQRWRYDLYRNLCHSIDAHGIDTLYRHDPFGRILRHSRQGNHKHFIYDEAGRLVAAGTVTGDTNTHSWQYHYRENSPYPSAITDPEKEQWKFEHDERGQLRVLTDPEGGRLTLEWSAQCRLIELVHGDRYASWDYDNRGNIVRYAVTGQADREWQYDNHGNLAQTFIGSSAFTILSDEYGRPCTISREGEVLLQWQYDDHGRVRHIQELSGPALKLEYNRQGRLSTLRCQGQTYTWRYNQFGELTNFKDGCTLQREWQYRNDGSLREFRDSDSHWYLEYNDTGELQQIRNNSGQLCHFHFDTLGRLTQAANEFCNLRYRYDRRGLLTAEHHDLNSESAAEGGNSSPNTTLSINHRYDRRGWLKNSCSDQINIAFIFSPAGRLYGIDTNGVMTVRSEIEAQNQHDGNSECRENLSLGAHLLEKSYRHGRLESVWLDGDALWRIENWCTEKTADARLEHLPRLTLLNPQPAAPGWGRDAHNNIVADARMSPNSNTGYRYQYDGWGLLHCVECGDFKTWLRCDPFGRRLVKTSTHRRSGRQRRIATHWSGIGLWSEFIHLNNTRTIAHFLHHPTTGIPLARLTLNESDDTHNVDNGLQADSFVRTFFVADDGGRLLALLPDARDGGVSKPLWHFEPATAPENETLPLCPGSFQGSLGIYDGEVQLFYRDFRYFIPTPMRSGGKIHTVPGTPLDGGSLNLAAALPTTAPGNSESTSGAEPISIAISTTIATPIGEG
ncbi:DUF6531 domain-containing protein [uncultured Microbulbifer sp.]|uniref:DUF6531 domain-containing protein n=1 Tax=uncultured Microbulbifer sp. TaxID=348147 RepID=UPI00260FB77A|nr:DUF6531 domain-containing protein [uncultured Microbulbifer sp.]